MTWLPKFNEEFNIALRDFQPRQRTGHLRPVCKQVDFSLWPTLCTTRYDAPHNESDTSYSFYMRCTDSFCCNQNCSGKQNVSPLHHIHQVKFHEPSDPGTLETIPGKITTHRDGPALHIKGDEIKHLLEHTSIDSRSRRQQFLTVTDVEYPTRRRWRARKPTPLDATCLAVTSVISIHPTVK